MGSIQYLNNGDEVYDIPIVTTLYDDIALGDNTCNLIEASVANSAYPAGIQWSSMYVTGTTWSDLFKSVIQSSDALDTLDSELKAKILAVINDGSYFLGTATGHPELVPVSTDSYTQAIVAFDAVDGFRQTVLGSGTTTSSSVDETTLPVCTITETSTAHTDYHTAWEVDDDTGEVLTIPDGFWDEPVDPENPLDVPVRHYFLYGTRTYDRYSGSLTVTQYDITGTITQSFTVTITSTGSGTVTPNGAQQVEYGNSLTISFTPTSHHHTSSVEADGISITPAGTQYTFSSVTEDHTLDVTFSIDTFTVTALSDNGHGSIDPAESAVDYGNSITLVISPDRGYAVKTITDNDTEIAVRNVYTIHDVTEDHTVTVHMVKNAAIRSLYGNPIAFPYNGPFVTLDWNNMVNAMYADVGVLGALDNIQLYNNNVHTLNMTSASAGSFVYLPMLESYNELERVRWGQWNAVMVPQNIFPYPDQRVKVTHLDHLRNSPVGRKLVYTILDVGYVSKYSYYWQSSWGIGTPEWITGVATGPGKFTVDHSNTDLHSFMVNQMWLGLANKIDGVVLAGADTLPGSLSTFNTVLELIKQQPALFDILVSVDHDSYTNTQSITGTIDGVIFDNLLSNSEGVLTDSDTLQPAYDYLDGLIAAGKRVYVVERTVLPEAQSAVWSLAQLKGYPLYMAGLDPGKVYETDLYGPWRNYHMTPEESIHSYYTTGIDIAKTYL